MRLRHQALAVVLVSRTAASLAVEYEAAEEPGISPVNVENEGFTWTKVSDRRVHKQEKRDIDEALSQLDASLKGGKTTKVRDERPLRRCRPVTVRGGRLGDGCPTGYTCSLSSPQSGVCIKKSSVLASRALQAKKKKKFGLVFGKKKTSGGIIFKKKMAKRSETTTITSTPSLAPVEPTSPPTVYDEGNSYTYGESCFTGSAAEIQIACERDSETYYCCYGNGSCDFEGTNVTVCAGACNGEKACHGIPDDSIISYDACNGDLACASFQSTSGVVIRRGSCEGLAACNATTLETIYRGACVGFQACDGLNGTVVGAEACYGPSACQDSRVDDIGEGSCRNPSSCFDHTSERIGKLSCLGNYACAGGSGDTIGDNACLGDSACFQATGMIGNDSCRAGDVNPYRAYVCLETRADIGDRSCNNKEKVCAYKREGTIIGDDQFSY